MPVRVGINGFGRVGRCFLRAAYERGATRLIELAERVMAPIHELV
jgi:glyceraldehyde-3-phosphate dehydrogenase/erythrose-4-phosphate dehydrogenase